MKVLFVTSEVWPFIKTGGLGDVSYSLPHALIEQGCDVRLLMPAYRDLLKKTETFTVLGWLSLRLAGVQRDVRIIETQHADFAMPIWLVDAQQFYDRPGNPYVHADGYDWPDNAERFTLFAKAAAMLGVDAAGIGWEADVIHSNDWQTGMVSAFLDEEIKRPGRVFTIHNMAYGGHFSNAEYNRLQLPWHWWSSEGIEFYGNFSMLKAGIVYSDAVTTVSPTYAQEICTPAYGYGMENVLSSRQYKLSGILNGIDTKVWDPASDPLIPHHFSVKRRNPGKLKNKRALLQSYGLPVSEDALNAPLLGMVSRLVEQKGVDMIVDAIPQLLVETNVRFALLGAGHAYFETRLRQLNAEYPDRVFITIGYDEAQAHLVEAGADIFLMPSRFEPCGLNQMYSLKYGTLPVVHKTGGLADTVIDAGNGLDDETQFVTRPNANGFVFDTPNRDGLIHAVKRALTLFGNKRKWNELQRNAMQQDFGWAKSARQYLDIYNRLTGK